jgi:predicted NBD/HSP70 family sugar kinase
LLAEACLDAGDHLRAGELAHKAAEVLGAWQHCEMASCLTTIALAEGLPEHAEKARQLIEADSLLLPDAKKRLLDAQTARMKRFARPDAQLIANAE